MIVIAEVGTSKGDWRLITDKRVYKFKTNGFNPVHDLSLPFLLEVKKICTKYNHIGEIKKVFYYGAGIVNKQTKTIVKNILSDVYKSAKIQVESDILAAAKSSLGENSGIVCILGTGSNSVHYDGKKIIQQTNCLGYIVGDEGSGTDMSKRLIKSYFYNELKPDIHSAFKRSFRMNRASFVETLYTHEKPAKFLAKHTKFILKHRNQKQIKEIIHSSLSAFVNHHVLCYQIGDKEKIHFIGSIAYLFKKEILSILKKKKLNPGKFIQQPIDDLVIYHTEK